MPTDLKSTLSVKITAAERETSIGVGAASSQLLHVFGLDAELANGTASNQADVVFSGSVSLSGATTLDLRGSLSSVLTGDSVSFVEIVAVALRNKETAAGKYVDVGGGSNPVSSLWIASGDGVRVGPGGIFLLTSPVDGYTTTTGTADILTLTPASTADVDYIILGRSA